MPEQPGPETGPRRTERDRQASQTETARGELSFVFGAQSEDGGFFPFFSGELAGLTEDSATPRARTRRTTQTLQTVILSEVEWTPQNGFLTAAQKLQRKTILNHFKAEIDVRFLSLVLFLCTSSSCECLLTRCADGFRPPYRKSTRKTSSNQPVHSGQQYRSFPVHSFRSRVTFLVFSQRLLPYYSWHLPLSFMSLFLSG